MRSLFPRVVVTRLDASHSALSVVAFSDTRDRAFSAERGFPSRANRATSKSVFLDIAEKSGMRNRLTIKESRVDFPRSNAAINIFLRP
jgi:hypothetical protein